jgi:hypothetical protein
MWADQEDDALARQFPKYIERSMLTAATKRKRKRPRSSERTSQRVTCKRI